MLIPEKKTEVDILTNVKRLIDISKGLSDDSLHDTYQGLSKQGVWVSFGHQNPQKSHIRTPKNLCEDF